MVLNILQGYDLGLVTFMIMKLKITSKIHFLAERNIRLNKVTSIDGNILNQADATVTTPMKSVCKF